jgi:gliding motility-associated-like protein|tara:strand:- start:288 stop:1463 length:1176 start_codon:yes stop_codon:yes gene_type:complete
MSTIIWAQTCDLILISQTPPATTDDVHSFVVEFSNAENCGCNEFNQSDGNTCDENGSSSVNNNENVSHLVFGIHYVDEITGQDLGENTDCTSTTFHPGWSYSNVTNWGGWETGTTATINLNPPFAWECILSTPIEGYCWEVVIWQINLSQTAGYDDFPDDGWTLGNSFNQTQMYPDINISDNRIAVCYDECESDTIIEYITDTIVITEYENVYITDTLLITEYENVYIYDTITQYINLYDTLYIDNFIFDTTYVEVVVDNYIYVTDTITEYILQEIWIDCESGLECTDEPIGFDCESTTLYVPNTFTPNNDGVNDVWKIVYESTCWKQIDFTIYNRWGDVVFRGADDEFWDGSLNGGSYYVADGVYTYTLVGRREESLEYIQKSGMITVFR